ncbi:MAG: hypothetical protein ACRYFY_12260 [Janthinobacterium lividum]
MGFTIKMKKWGLTIQGSRYVSRVACGLMFLTLTAHALAEQSSGKNTAKPTIAESVAQLPKAPALNVINDKCSACHSVSTVFGQRRSPNDWAATVQLMVDRGADLSPDEVDSVVGYLSSNYSAK